MDTSSKPAPIRQPEIDTFIQVNPLVRHWLSKWKPITQKLYAIDIIRFQQLSHTEIEQLLPCLENNQLKPREIRSLIESSLTGLSNSVQARIDSAVRSFFKHHLGKLPVTTIKYQKIRDYRAYHKDELQSVIGFLDKPLEQLFAIIASESGLRAGTILQLKWRHIEQDFNNRIGSIAIRLENSFHTGRKKSGFTFIGDRARHILKRSTETSRSDRGYRIYTQSDRNMFPYSYDSILPMINTAKDKAQLTDPCLSPVHSFRKFFREQLTAAEIHPDHIKVLFGRFDDTDAKAYTSKEFETLRPEYETAYPYLDYMNDNPKTTTDLSTKQTQLHDIVKQQTDRILEQDRKINALVDLVRASMKFNFSNADSQTIESLSQLPMIQDEARVGNQAFEQRLASALQMNQKIQHIRENNPIISERELKHIFARLLREIRSPEPPLPPI